MKAVLFFCLLALFSCKCNFFQTVQCLISEPKVQQLALKLLNLVYNKDFSSLLPTLRDSFPVLRNAFIECRKESTDVVLKGGLECKHWIKYTVCCAKCPLSSQQCCTDCYNDLCK